MVRVATRPLLVAILSVVTVSAFQDPRPRQPPRYGTFGIDQTAFDVSVTPGDDFWAYVNGGWEKRTEIPPDRPAIGIVGLANAHWPPARMREAGVSRAPMTLAELETLAPQFDWPLMMATRGLAQIPATIVLQSTAITATGVQLTATPLDIWKDWLAFQFISDRANVLPRVFQQARFGFFTQTLNGVPEEREPWRRAVQFVNNGLGDAVGEIYVARHYPAASRAQMAELVSNLRGAFEERLKTNTWMDDATRTEALKKLTALATRIGHPDTYTDYSALTIARDDLFGNVARMRDFEWQLRLSRLGKPVDHSRWNLTPQTVNATYGALTNQITFPAAFLQPPHFDPHADPAVNYGAIGAVIGHEIGHAFDDVGSQFDGTGTRRDWWTPAARQVFNERAAALGAQFEGYEPLPGVRINASLTMGENIGDLAGVEMAYAAYQRYQAKHGAAPVLDGMTGNQRFFLSYAQKWRSKRREGSARQLLQTDPHSPNYYRVNGIVRNVDAWHAAFDVKPGDKLYLAPEARVRIW
jgi:endothelin-converting enzyme/putative endopeptidase